jgi:hypothetical protein
MVNAIDSLLKQSLPIKVVYALSKNVNTLLVYSKNFEATRNNYIMANGENNEITKESDKWTEFESSMLSLLDDTIEVELVKVKLSQLPDSVSCTYQTMVALNPIIEDDYSPVDTDQAPE